MCRLEPSPTILLDEPRKLVGNYKSLRPVHRHLDLLSKHANFLRIGLRSFVLFRLQPAVCRFDGVEGLLSPGQLVVPMVSVPLKAMCSNMCAIPVWPEGSSTDPAFT